MKTIKEKNMNIVENVDCENILENNLNLGFEINVDEINNIVINEADVIDEIEDIIDLEFTQEPPSVDGKLTKQELEAYSKEYLWLIPYVLKNFQNTNMSNEELQNIAIIGYKKALVNFDKNKCIKFTTHAINYIHNEIILFLGKDESEDNGDLEFIPEAPSVDGKLTKRELEEYAEQHMRLIPYVLKSFYNTNIPYDELQSVGTTGYTKALVNFDKNKGVKFSTYAINCIRNEVLFFLRKENKHMKNTTSLNTILATDKNGAQLELEEIVSIDELNGKSLEDNILEDETRQILLKAIDELSEKEKLIIIYRFGLNKGIKKTQKALAEETNMSQANVSKIEEKAIKKLKGILKKYM